MKLFEIDENNEVKINYPWIKLIPEFKALFDGRLRTKEGSMRDSIGVKRITYIYFMMDFTSPIADWEISKKKEESMKYSGLSNLPILSTIVKSTVSK